jgi:hypothetical protein
LTFQPPKGYQDLVSELKRKLLYQGFPVWGPTIKEGNAIIFNTLAMKADE